MNTLTDTTIIIRQTRNDYIKHLLEADNLLQYLITKYSVESTSTRRMEIIKRALQLHSITPVDLVHYSSLILEFKTSQEEIDVVIKRNGIFFTGDIDNAIKNFLI